MILFQKYSSAFIVRRSIKLVGSSRINTLEGLANKVASDSRVASPPLNEQTDCWIVSGEKLKMV